MSSVNVPCVNVPQHLAVDTFPGLLLDHPSLGHSYFEDNISSDTPVFYNDSTGSWPFVPTGLPVETVPGSTASLGDPGRLNPFLNTGFDQLKLPSGRTQPNDSDGMVEASFLSGAHVDTEARPNSFSALRSLPVGKPEETDDRITVTDIDRLLGINHDRVCTCLNCLDYNFPINEKPRDQFPALRYISCRVEGCTWNHKIYWFNDECARTKSHEESHFREETRDQDGKLIFTCKDDRCQIRTKRRDDVKRHYATVHCKNPQRYPCHVIGCQFGGENGFTRKDKLTSHMKSTHKGLPFLGKHIQAIKPKAGISNAGVHKAGSKA